MIPVVVAAMLAQALAVAPRDPPMPFGVGETLEYTGHWSAFKVGDVTLRVVGIENVRGLPAWHFSLVMNVSALIYHNHTELDSWTGVEPFVSRRFKKVIDEKDLGRNDDFRIFPDSGYFRNNADTTHHPTPPDPIDDLAFIYYLRTAPLKEHTTYQIPRYYRMDKNPVIIEVLGREVIQLDDGTRRYCWVLHPIVDEPHGMFARDHDARIWLTDDGLRIPAQIRSSYPVAGAITLKLRKTSVPH